MISEQVKYVLLFVLFIVLLAAAFPPFIIANEKTK